MWLFNNVGSNQSAYRFVYNRIKLCLMFHHHHHHHHQTIHVRVYPILRHALITLWNSKYSLYVFFFWGRGVRWGFVLVRGEVLTFQMFVLDLRWLWYYPIPWITIPVYIHTVQSVHALYPNYVLILYPLEISPWIPRKNPINSDQSPWIPIIDPRWSPAAPRAMMRRIPPIRRGTAWYEAGIVRGLWLTPTEQKTYGCGSIPIDTFLVGWTSIYQLFWGSLRYQGFDPSPYGKMGIYARTMGDLSRENGELTTSWLMIVWRFAHQTWWLSIAMYSYVKLREGSENKYPVYWCLLGITTVYPTISKPIHSPV